MFEFATSQKYASLFHDQIFLQGKLQPTLARVAVKRAAFTARPAKWYLVEELKEDWPADSSHDADASVPVESYRIVGGENCKVAGFYFTPAMTKSRQYFAAGEVTPTFDAQYGQAFWQWDAVQK